MKQQIPSKQQLILLTEKNNEIISQAKHEPAPLYFLHILP